MKRKILCALSVLALCLAALPALAEEAAEKGTREKAHPDDGEFVQSVWIPEAEVREMLARGEIRDAKTIAAVQAYFLSK